MALCGLAAAFFCLFLVAPCRAQIANVTDDTSTPIPGAGHDYIKMFNETVNPANGSVSLRIQVPVPPGRRLSIPFAFAYDSNGVHHLSQTGMGSAVWWSDSTVLSKGGWSYALPTISFRASTIDYNPFPQHDYKCDFSNDYIFGDPLGGRHALGIAYVWDSYQQCGSVRNPPHTVSSGGDDIYYASMPSGEPLNITDPDGTTYNFQGYGGRGGGGFLFNIPVSATDRNGNAVTFSLSGQNVTVKDSLLRNVVSTSGFGATGNTVTVSGLPSPSYTLTWGTASTNFPRPGVVGTGSNTYCQAISSDVETQPVISEIALPNGTSYQFLYEGTFGLLRQVIYPTGGWIKYSWGWSSTPAEFTSFTDSQGNPGNCKYEYDNYQLQHRYVSFDGTNTALQQDFSYTTTWQVGPSGVATWTTKTTTVTTHDLLAGTSYTTVYTYGSVTQPAQPDDCAGTNICIQVGQQIPIETQVAYNGGSLRSVTKAWYDQFELGCELDSQDASGLGGLYYLYGAGAQVTDKKEYNYGQITGTSACSQSQVTAPGTTATRETVITYDTALTNSYGYHIDDRPSDITINGNGARAAETTYGYDSKGNALTKTRKCLYGCSSDATTGYGYDGYGNATSMTDPRLNATNYEYNSTYAGAYLTKITYPMTSGASHVESFGYDFNSGELTSSTDQNGQVTTYHYNDNLARLTETDYPCTAAGCGNTKIMYNDSPLDPSVTVSKLLTGSTTYNTTSTMDGMGHVTKVAITSDPAGTDFTDTTYDGEGHAWCVSNPYRGSSTGSTCRKHDALGRVTQVQYQDGNLSPIMYSGTSNADCATTTDPAGKTNETCSDALGRLTSDIDGLGNTTSYGYNAMDDLTSVTQGGQSRSFAYDSLSEMYQATNPESGTTTYSYDGNGNILSRTDARGIATSYNCNGTSPIDALNRVTCKSYSDGTPQVNFSYDQSSVTIGNWTSPALQYPTGRMTEATTTASAATQTAMVYSYDAMGRVANLWQCAPYNCGSASIWSMPYSYDLAGNVTGYTNPAGFTVSQQINGAQQPTSLTYGGSMAVSSITYEPWGAISTMCGGQGCAQSQETRQYNSRLQPVLMELGNSSNLTADYCLVYNYYTSVANPTGCAMPSQGTGDNGNIMASTTRQTRTRATATLGPTLTTA